MYSSEMNKNKLFARKHKDSIYSVQIKHISIKCNSSLLAIAVLSIIQQIPVEYVLMTEELNA